MDCVEFMKLVRESDFISLRINGQYYDFDDDYTFLVNFELDNGDMIHLNDYIDVVYIEQRPFDEALKIVKQNIRSKKINKVLNNEL